LINSVVRCLVNRQHQLVCVPQQNPPRSGLWTTSPSHFVLPSLFLALTPLFPLDASHSPVTPLFPLHTQKQGGTPPSSGMTNRSISEMHSHRPIPACPCFLCALRDGSDHLFFSLATRLPAVASAEEGHSPLSLTIPAPLATAALRVVSAPIFTTKSRIHVGPPTFSPPRHVSQVANHGSQVTRATS
jgi:hypothetical protein